MLFGECNEGEGGGGELFGQGMMGGDSDVSRDEH